MGVLRLMMLFLMFSTALQSYGQVESTVKITFKVWGNCGMCKTKIEQSAKSVKGVTTVKWSIARKRMTLRYNPQITTPETVQKKIASVGYDTEKYKATDEAYNALHHCCKYDRN